MDYSGQRKFSLPFGDFVVKPVISYAIFILLVLAFTMGILKLRKVQFEYQDVVARFGTSLIPTVAILFIGLLLSIMNVDYFLFFVLIGFAASVFMVPALVISSYKTDSTNGFDAIYGILITYTLTFITLYIMNDFLFSTIKGYFVNLFSNSFF
ncbi:zinc ribbon domain-containing protein (plasmid) [Rossellomorea sp. AcN35-11]|nr:zinc ribbon domain-containing protein [Rossellomorea sp. AcN35-11]